MKKSAFCFVTTLLCTCAATSLSAKEFAWGNSYESDAIATVSETLDEYRVGKSSLRASDVQEAIREVKSLNKKVDELERKNDELARKNRDLESQNGELVRKVEDNRQQLRSLESEMKNLSSKIK